MRKIQRISKPDKLTDFLQTDLTNKFKANPKLTVWDKPFIRENLLSMSNNKCCYCETKLGPGYKEMHVDHYHPKSLYPNEVVDWENLFPSCPHCNKSKSDHDTYAEPIVNPCCNDPRRYFYFRNFRYRSKEIDPDSIGKRTIRVLKLNVTDDLENTRFRVAEMLANEIESIFELASDNKDILISNTRKRNRVINGCKNLLKLCLPHSEYGSCMSTNLHDDANFIELCNIIKQINLWDGELEDLYNLSISIRYDSK